MLLLPLLLGCATWGNVGTSFPLVGLVAQAVPEEKEVIAKAALVAYAANINAFPHYTCRYRTTTGKAKSIEDALQGHFVDAKHFDARVLVDGPKDLFQGLGVPPANNAPYYDNSVDAGLGDGKLGLGYTPFLRTAGVYPMDGPGTHVVPADFPLAMGGFIGDRNVGGPNVKYAATDKFRLTAVDLEEIEGRPVVTIQFEDQRVAQTHDGPVRCYYRYSLDRGKGYLPIRIALYHNKKPAVLLYVTHVRECSDKRWFPERFVRVWPASKPGDLHGVKAVRVLDLDVDKRPREEDFRLVLPAGINVVNPRNLNQRFQLKQQETITPEDLPKLRKMLEEVQHQPLMDTAVPRSKWSTWTRWGGAGWGLLLALGGVAFLARRHWRMA